MTELTQSVRFDVQDGIAVITIDNPPVNALSHHVRQGILDGMRAAGDDGSVQAVVLICAGRTFISGADIAELSQAPRPPSLASAQAAMENSLKPVVAAIHGTALGGGLEVAMCAHYRVAAPGSELGLPEVKLGLLPGAGGTQRLPRVTGVGKALEMTTSGRPIGVAEAAECGLVDEIIVDATGHDALLAGAVVFARRRLDDGSTVIPIRDRTDELDHDPGIFDTFRASIAHRTRGFLAPEYNIRGIEAAVTLPFDEGLQVERQLFTELMGGTQSRAQQHYFFAEREAAKIPDVPRDTGVLPVASVGILGCGTMGGGIAMSFANAGIPVTVVERDDESLTRGLAVIRSNYERTAARGRITGDDVETRMGLITGSIDRSDLAAADLLIEAVFEDLDLKRSVFAELDRIAEPGVILASNTSALDVNAIAAATSRPENVIGLHFFSPANVMKLVEVVRGDATADEVVATGMKVANQLGKIAVLVGVCQGFVGNRMLYVRRLEADRLMLEGATPARIDRVVYDFGFPMGPFAMSDLVGLDIGWNPETSSGSTVRERLCESGRRGQKNGRGYYTYDEDRTATADPEVEQLIRDFARERGIEQREVTDQEILERLLYPMVNEGAKILEEGIAIRPGDIDVVWVNGYGWPVYTGGPMFWADTVGLTEVAARIVDYHQLVGGAHWDLSPLLRRLAEGDTAFASLPAGRPSASG